MTYFHSTGDILVCASSYCCVRDSTFISILL